MRAARLVTGDGGRTRRLAPFILMTASKLRGAGGGGSGKSGVGCGVCMLPSAIPLAWSKRLGSGLLRFGGS